jgi:O-glycosyl hydrolase
MPAPRAPVAALCAAGLALIGQLASLAAAAPPPPGNGTQRCGASGHQTASITIDTRTQYQEIDGFGVSEAFQRAEDVLGKDGLSAANRDYVLDLLFSLDKGAGFTILRNGIGSSNSSAGNLMNSIEPASPGAPGDPPHYVWDGYDSGQFPLAQQAYARGLQKLYGDAWSAPGYMKTNGDENGGGYLCGVANTSCATGSWMQAYADYLVQWARFYHESGVAVTNLGFLNEPQLAASYAGMLSDGAQAADFIRVLARTIDASGLDLAINCCDGIGWEQQEQMMAGLAAGPDPAEAYLSVVTGHGYSSPPDFPLTTSRKTWVTEWCDLSGQFTPWTFYADAGPGEGMTWARHVQVALVDAGVSGFLYWIGAENSTTNSALINLLGNDVVPSKRFWAMAQFSRFVRPGARRVEAASSAPSLLFASAFANTDGALAVQVISNATAAYHVSLSVGEPSPPGATAQPYITNNAHNLTALAPLPVEADGSFRAVIPARSMMSFVIG